MWILPSRNRAQRVARMFDKAPPSTPGVVACDSDQADDYLRLELPKRWRVEPSPRCQYVAKHNALFWKYPDEPWYGSISDDMLPITPGWDTKLIERAGPRGLAYADDLYTRRSGAFAAGGDLVRALGWIFPPAFVHYYGDTTMEKIAREHGMAGLQRDVVVEHRHFGNKRNPGRYDRTSKERPELRAERAVWTTWLEKEWPSVDKRIREILDEKVALGSHGVDQGVDRHRRAS